MTVIVAALTKQGVVMAADSAISAGWQKMTHDTPKLWCDGQWTIGGAGCVRAAQVIRHHIIPPVYRADEDDHWERFLVRSFVPAIRAAMAGHGAMETRYGVESIPATLLVSEGNLIAKISGNGAVIAEPCGRMAIGSGYAEALGSLGDAGIWTEAQVIRAAQVARITADGVGGPIAVINCRTGAARQVEE